ncbi:helix-turn-helix domain-containing protein [Candidatus Kuenenbacteria bacterium]|nr:helix-turn-helix domain-containing protein [Candidatus Kuenenbacteria bacterium]
MRLEKTLQSYGLNQKQASVYLANLEIGSSPVQKIATKATLARSTVYEVLQSLTQLGFVSSFHKKKIKYFTAKEPNEVIRLAESKVGALKDALPELEAISGQAKQRPTVRFYQGKEEIKLILQEILDEADQLLSFGSAEKFLEEIGEFHEKTFLKQRIKRRIPLRLILRDTPLARKRQELGPGHLRQVKLSAEKHKHEGLIFIWKNKIAMISFVKDYVAVVTESQELADVQRAMFENLWDKL